MNIVRKTFAFVMAVMMVVTMSGMAAPSAEAASTGDLIKLSSDTAVYYVNGSNRHAFPHSSVYFTWYRDFNNVQVVSQAEMSNYTLTTNVTIRPGTKLMKITSDPKTYAVGMDRTIYHISSEQEAISMYGPNWAGMVVDVADSFFNNYTMGGQKPNGQYTGGQLVKAAGSPDVYYYTGSQFRKVAGENAFYANRFSFDHVVTAPSGFSMSPMGSDITGAEADITNTAQAAPGQVDPGFNQNGGTQGTIDNISLGSRNKTEALEAQSNVEIYATDVELSNDGPLMLQTADVWFSVSNPGTHSVRPWNYFKNVSLMVNGAVVGTMNADSSANWSSSFAAGTNIGNAGSNATVEYRMRFSGLSSVLASNATTKVSVAVSMHNNIDSNDKTAVWNLELGDIRILDESGLTMNQSAPALAANATALEEQFTVGGIKKASLEVRTANPQIDAAIVEVSETSDTNGVSVYTFTMKEKNGVAMTVNDLQVTFTTGDPAGTTAENSVIRRAYLYEGSTERSVKTVPNGGVTLFNNMNIALAANQTKTFTVKVDLFDTNEGVRYVEGTNLNVVVNAANFKGTDANGHDEDDIIKSVSATSQTHELRSRGIMVTVNEATTMVTTVDGANNDLVQFTWEVDVEAFGDRDVYINRAPADIVLTAGAAAGDVDIIYLIEYSGGAALINQSGTITTSSGSEVEAVTGAGGYTGAVYDGEALFRIAAGQTGTFTVTVTGTNQTDAKQVRALLQNIEWTVDEVTNGAIGGGVAPTISSYTFNLGNKAATPFMLVN